ncbi:MAG: sigma 54 modulation/S30EA ribosomal C-terminal domain-containing protein [Acidimicrobiales bacterium]|jgi:ribosomal subunit interface protein|nr:sigma 54 modulation/S30EA ribosomal C-terminal domain-containing protein [Acidimicrobiales bacterium]
MDVREFDVAVTTRGDVPDDATEYAVTKVAQLGRYTTKPVLFAQVKLVQEANPAHERPALAEATLDVNGRVVRAHVAAGDLMEAADLLEARMRRNLVRESERHEHGHERAPLDGEWRHGTHPVNRPVVVDRDVDEREVVRHKTFALTPVTADEAGLDLELLGHDFYLFTEVHSGLDAVLHVTDEGGLELQLARDGVARPPDCDDTIALGSAAPVLTLAEAEERLDVGHEPLVFFVDATTERGQVVYRRYDGHYGLITPA